MRVAYQGVPGAFGHQACLAFLPEHEPVAEPSFAAVVEAVAEGRAERGLIPVENSIAGLVEETRNLLDGAAVAVVGEPVLPVRMHLLGLPGARLDKIRTVVSHPVALRQCARKLDRLGLVREEASNTAVAAAALQDPTKAVLASAAAAEAYGLVILLADVHDRPDNATRFALLAPRGDPATSSNHSSVRA
ncbi:MAG TPA: prephenate dehydratase domain-containing protein [Allosphingosinicella sp.]|jgi:prephenate dehydratase|nr:prephenate dehydratase domain-containing protein [Allosphingosinicella sp.]